MKYLFSLVTAIFVVSLLTSASFIVSNISTASSVEAASRGGGSVRNSGRRSSSAKSNRASRPSVSKRSAKPRQTTKPKRMAEQGVRKPNTGRAPATERKTSNPYDRADHRYDHRYSHREDARRDYYRFRTVNHIIRLGAYVATRPRYSTSVVVSGAPYYYWGGVYYKPSGTRYIIVQPPPGAVVYSVPQTTTIVYAGTTPYYYYGGTYYVVTEAPANSPPLEAEKKPAVSAQNEDGMVETPPMIESDENYEVVKPPVGVFVPYLPEEATEVLSSSKIHYVYDGVYYRPFSSEGETVYMVAENPNK